MFLDFIQYIFLLILVSITLVFFVDGDSERFDRFRELMRNLAPMAYFGIAFLVSLKFYRRRYKQRKDDNNLEIVLTLQMKDKLIGEIISFLVPVAVLLIAFFNQPVSGEDIVQALLAFMLVFSFQRYLFSKENNSS